MENQQDEISLRPVKFTFYIIEYSRFSQDLHVTNQAYFVLKSALTFIVCEA